MRSRRSGSSEADRVHDERERKYEVDPSVTVEDLAAAVAGAGTVGPACSAVLHATYYDTARLELAAAKVTLRRRDGGDDAGWHLKLPGEAPDARAEYWLPLASGGASVPEDLRAMVAGTIGAADLRPVARIRTARTTIELVAPGGAPLAQVADDRVVTLRERDGALASWREVEVEAQRTDAAGQDDLEQRLASLGATRAPHPSKLARALARGDAPPARAGPIAARLQSQVGEVIRCELGARDGDDDAIHDLRVATRRLRSCLKTYARAFAADTTSPLLSELAHLGDVLGAARDAGVLAARLEGGLAAVAPEHVLGPVRAVLRSHGAREAGTARRALVALLDSPRYRELLEALVAFANDPPLRPGKRSARWYRAQVDRRRRRAERLAAVAETVHGPEHDLALHELRKAAKHVRYAAETARPVLGKPARRLARRFAAVQKALGEHHDAVVARAFLRDEGARAGVRPGENGFTYGMLYAVEDLRARSAEAEFQGRWRRAERARH